MTNTKLMLEAIAVSGSDNCRATAQKIIAGTTTIEQEECYCGSFMKAVFSGDFLAAYAVADSENKLALKSILN